MTEPRAIFVTGGGSGTGAAVARALTAAGDRVAICGRRADALRAVAAQTGALDLVCDISDPRQAAGGVQAAAREFGRLDGMAAFGAERGLGVAGACELVTALVPQRRPAHADEVAATVTWLLSSAASDVNGAVIPVDGSASAVDVGTMAFDARMSLRPDDRS